MSDKSMKLFLVTVQAYRTVVVKAENQESAEQTASEECTDSKWNTERWEARELEGVAQVKDAIRHGASQLNDW